MSSVAKRVELCRLRNNISKPKVVNNNSVWNNILEDVCSQCSVHGLNHIIKKDRSLKEKTFWTIVVILAILLATYAIFESWMSYNKSTIDTVVETTFFNYAEIAFPSVFICDSSRVDWDRVMKLTPDKNISNLSDIPEFDPKLLPIVRKVLKTFSLLSYGDFDQFDELVNVTELSQLKTLNLTEMLFKVMRPCNEMFIGNCWWNFKEVNCCEIFEVHRTEFGLCHSFNSDFSEYSRARLGADSGQIGHFWRTERGEIRPRRTGDKGQWSGIRMYISTMKPEQIAPGINAKPSVRVMMGEPRGAPLGSDMVVMAGSFGNIHVWGDRIYNTKRTRMLNPKKRKCLFPDESGTGMGTKYYLRRNCKTACYMNHVLNYCGCYLEFMFALMTKNDSLRPCHVEDLLCLSQKNLIFNNFIPAVATSFFQNEPPGVKCDCMPDCHHQMYISELTIAEPSVTSVFNSSSSILIDLHFRQSTCILYRSDLVLSWLDLLVSFGGCAGLFLGASLLSFIELIYFLTWRVYYHWKGKQRQISKKKSEFEVDTWNTDNKIKPFLA